MDTTRQENTACVFSDHEQASESAERIGIYGGTFAPVHSGHLRAAAAFLSDCALDRLLFMPAGIPPHKQLSGRDLPIHRLEMLRLAVGEVFGGDPRVEVSDYEIAKEGVSYTYLTLEHFAREDRKLFLLMGTDMFLSLDSWRCPERIFSLAEIVLARRECDEALSCEIAQKAEEYRKRFGASIRILPITPLAVSSTELRRQIAEDALSLDKVPTSVANYLRSHHLYQDEQEDKA